MFTNQILRVRDLVCTCVYACLCVLANVCKIVCACVSTDLQLQYDIKEKFLQSQRKFGGFLNIQIPKQIRV